SSRVLQRRRRASAKVSVASLLTFVTVVLPSSAISVSSAEKKAAAFISDVQNVRKISVTLNKSRTFRVERPFTTVVVGSPDIADVRSLSDRVIYVLGKKVGTTNISVFDDTAQMIGILDVEVSVDVGNVQQKISASTGAGGIRVSAAQGQVVLSGTAVDA